MATLRRPHLAHVLILVACSSADPSAGAGSIEGVPAIESVPCGNGACPEQFVRSAAVASGVVWLARDRNDCAVIGGTSGGCATWSGSSHLERASFGADGGAGEIAASPAANVPNNGVLPASGVGVTDDGSAVYFAYDDETSGRLVVRALGADGADAGALDQSGTADVVGVAAEARAAVVAVSNGGSPNTDSSQGPTGSGPPSSPSGALLRFDFVDGGVTQAPMSGAGVVTTTFDAHLFAADATNVYWAAADAIYQAPRADVTAQTPFAPLDVTDGGAPVGLTVANGAVAWSILYAKCSSGPCVPTGCRIYVGGAAIWDSAQSSAPSKGCLGLAIDSSHAYFAVADWRTYACNNCGPGNGTTTEVVTTAIGRVALAGPPSQQPTFLTLSNDRVFGPRRFIVDDTYVYGIDPEYVLRIPKTAFGP